jgi:hypothetical protein
MSKYSQKLMGKEVGQAHVYAEPHTMQGKKASKVESGRKLPFNKKKDWTPMDGVSITSNDEVKTTGIKIRGTGAATKGVMARGPMG